MTRRRAFGQISTLPSGRHRARYRGPDGERHAASGTFRLKTDAEAWLHAEGVLIASGAWTPPAVRAARAQAATMTVADYGRAWLASRAASHDLAPRTVQHYRSLFERHVVPTFGDRRWADVTRFEVVAWFRDLVPGRATLRAQTYTLFRQIAAAAVDEGHMTANPVEVKKGTRVPGRSTNLRRFPSSLDIERIAKGMPEQWQMLVTLAAWSGLRFGELTELRRRDVDLDVPDDVDRARGSLDVTRGVVYLDREDGPKPGEPAQRYIGPPKSDAGTRRVFLPAPVVVALAQHMRDHVEPGADALLFHAVTDPTRHLAESTMHRHYARAREAAGWPALRFHDLRHVAGTRASQAGATRAEVMAYLGHSTDTAAARYQHAADERMTALADRLGAMF